jgi:hypothetical protein
LCASVEVLRFGTQLGGSNTTNRQQEGNFLPCLPCLVALMAAAHHFTTLRTAWTVLQLDSFTYPTMHLMRS